MWASFYELKDRCPSCGYGFVREDGYWVGAMIIAMAVTEFLFALVVVGGIVLLWPDPPWNGLLVAGLAINAIVPWVLYPFSKTFWVGLDLFFNPPTASEEAEAEAARAAHRDLDP